METLKKFPITLNSVFPTKSLKFSVYLALTVHLNGTSLISST